MFPTHSIYNTALSLQVPIIVLLIKENNLEFLPVTLPLIITFLLWDIDFLVSYSSSLTLTSAFSIMWYLNPWFLDPGSFSNTDSITTAQRKVHNHILTICQVSKTGLESIGIVLTINIFFWYCGSHILYLYKQSSKNK